MSGNRWCVMVVEAAPPRVRGVLTRWFVEPSAGVYVGTVTGTIRREVWDVVVGNMADGSAVCVWDDPTTEQGFRMAVHGDKGRAIAELDGVELIRFSPSGR